MKLGDLDRGLSVRVLQRYGANKRYIHHLHI